MEIIEKDKLWVDNRYKYMVDIIVKLMGDFKSFIEKNFNFVGKNENEISFNDI